MRCGTLFPSPRHCACSRTFACALVWDCVRRRRLLMSVWFLLFVRYLDFSTCMYFILFRAFVSPVFYTRSFMVCSLVCLQNKIRNVELTRDRNEPKHARNISLGCAQRLRSETHEKLHANKSNVFLRLLNVFKSILKKAERRKVWLYWWIFSVA